MESVTKPSSHGKTVLLLHNPRSGSHHAIEIIESLQLDLQKAGFDTEAISDLTEFENRARQLAAGKILHAVIAAGGDGTVAAVANRLSPEVPIAIAPLGTENLIAKYLRCYLDSQTIVKSIVAMKTRTIDAGLANGKLFLVMVGVGFDAEVVLQMHRTRRGHIRRWHYWIAILKAIAAYRFPRMILRDLRPKQLPTSLQQSEQTADDEQTFAWCFVQNLAMYADGMMINPDVIDNDGKLDISTFRQGGFWSGLYYLARLRTSTHRGIADFRTKQLSKFEIALTDKRKPNIDVPFQIDGDFGGNLPLTIEVLPQRICLIESL